MLNFDVYAMTDPKTPEDYKVLWNELVQELSFLLHTFEDRLGRLEEKNSGPQASNPEEI